MRGRTLWLVLLIVACKEDQVPQGLYDYQVERLLSGGDSKTWMLVSENRDGTVTTPNLCSDSLQLLITTVGSDSINISKLTPNSDCTILIPEDLGNANASGDLIFTDSLIFKSGEVWIINQITSKNLSLNTGTQTEIWSFE